MQSLNQWKADEYDNKLAFVSGYGKNLISWLQPKKGEYILDLGCGTGDLTHEISLCEVEIVGIDASSDMIRRARDKYPHLEFKAGDGHYFETNRLFDAIFSNAALHWMRDPELVVSSIWNALKPGGRFVAEFGGKGNVDIIVHALEEVIERSTGMDASARNPWYFPTIGEYSSLLEKQGFMVRQAYHYDRPTKLSDGDRGIEGWLSQFGGDYFQGLDTKQIQEICLETSKRVVPQLWKEDAIYADYKRLRVEAVKPVI
ncbi:class I SAM-dependent methyltransferase [Paenibacillus sp. MER 99-2]|uniref:class I SAM-dependent methyltransferase n=1 Tax=Paenibacillus sp. MER 99-2 TaxID=2939572 RepID=UPI00203F51EC|nr:class I SAM-dependent methyltransferase [Paenibacillus sp. MER 99-2]MCM3175197.1 class I SAM-dependent methyltransferase [Paenibacillus sp. MER 99-2]